MASKTFKLGEVAKGGVITVNATSKEVVVITKDWDYSAGSNKGSNQSNAEELYRKSFSLSNRDAERNILWYLGEETTSYYADKILDWVKTKVKFNQDTW
jgi:hypothetical protein